MSIQTITSPIQEIASTFEERMTTLFKYSSVHYKNRPLAIEGFYDTPFFKRYLSTCDESDLVGFYTTINYILNVRVIQDIWIDVPFDHFQTYTRILEIIPFYAIGQDVKTQEWMRNSLSALSFLHMLQTYYNKEGLANTDRNLKDTFNQLNKLLTRKDDVPRPNRWRLMEFHDHISHHYIISTTENVEHKNEFVPFPVEKDDVKIYQPKDTLQLKLWGKSVRNCVASYEDKILRNSSAIFLIEKEGKPTYTYELDYSALKENRLQILQCVGIGNSSIPQEERTKIESALQQVVIST